MQVTLRKARQIEKLLNKAFNSNVETTGEYSVHRDTDFLNDELNVFISDFSEGLSDLHTINNAIFEIREAIHEKNESFGINALIGTRAKAVNILTRLQSFAFCETISGSTILTQKVLAARKNLGQNVYGSNSDTIEISKCTETQLEAIETDIAEFKQQIVNLDDLILTNNLNTKIELSDTVLVLLNKLKIPH